MERFTADDARTLSQNSNEEILERLIGPVNRAIKAAALQGKKAITLSDKGYSYDERKKLSIYLEGLGFKTEYYSGVQWDPCDQYTISWQ